MYKYFLQARSSEIILQMYKTFLNICKYIFYIVYVKKDVQKLYKVLIMLKYFFVLEWGNKIDTMLIYESLICCGFTSQIFIWGWVFKFSDALVNSLCITVSYHLEFFKEKTFKEHSQLAPMRIRYHFIANLHITETRPLLLLTKYDKNNVTGWVKAHPKTDFSVY